MESTNRKTIIEQIKIDVDNKLNSGEGYQSDLMGFRVGVFDATEFDLLPSAGLWLLEDLLEEDLMDETTFRRLNLIIYAYVDSDGLDSYTSMYNLIDDFEKFLYSSDSTYYENTFLGNVVITYGGTNEQIGMFVLNFSILYTQSGLSS